MSTATPTRTKFAHDQHTFLKKIPYKLTPSNLEGAYFGPPIPDGFDAEKASALELVKAGILIRRPTQADPPAAVDAWKKLTSRQWLAKDRVVSRLVPRPGKTHLLGRTRTGNTDQEYFAGTWAGAAIQTGTWTGVVGIWTIPTVSEPSEPQGFEGGWNSSSWVGIDGFNVSLTSNDVLQAGIQQTVDANGNANYVAWYEWFAPQQDGSPGYIFTTDIPDFAVSPGNEIYCSVQYVSGNTAGYIYLANDTTGQYFSITLAPPPGATFAGNTVEWVMEAPDGGEPTSSLPAFTSVQFTSAIACAADGSLGNPLNADTVNVETASGQVLTSVELGSYTVEIDFIG